MPANRLLATVEAVLEPVRLGVGLRPQRLQPPRRLDAARHPVHQPLLQLRLVVLGELAVVGQQNEHRPRVAQVALGEVVLLGAHDRRGDEVAVARSGLLHEVAAEELADQRLEHHVGGEDRLAPVVDGGERLCCLPYALPRRVAVPGLQMGRAVEPLDLLAERQAVQREILRGADPVHAVHRDRVVVHVRRRAPVGVREQVQSEPVVDVHPGADVTLHEAHPVRVPLLERLRLAGRLDVLAELAYDVGVVAVERQLPLLVGVAELVPAERRPVVALAAGTRSPPGLGAVRAPRLEGRPVQRVAAAAVGEPVQPSLAEVVPRVGLHLDGHVLVVRLLALLREVVVEPACGRVRELFGAGFGVGEDGLGNAAFS